MNIEELARQAGTCKILKGYFFQWELSDLERFASLVLEQAAQTTDDGSIEGKIFAEAIRAMKPTQDGL